MRTSPAVIHDSITVLIEPHSQSTEDTDSVMDEDETEEQYEMRF